MTCGKIRFKHEQCSNMENKMLGLSRKNWFISQGFAIALAAFIMLFSMLIKIKLGLPMEIPALVCCSVFILFISDMQRARATDVSITLTTLTVISYVLAFASFYLAHWSLGEMVVLLLLFRSIPFMMLASFPSVRMMS